MPPWQSFDDALKPVETPTAVCDNGPYLIHQGALAAVAVHEASHAVLMVCTGQRVGGIEVAMSFERGYGGVVVARTSGRASHPDATGSTFKASPAAVPVRRPHDAPIYCWRAFLKDALATAAGPAGEFKYRSLAGLPRGFVGGTDASTLEWYRRVLWTTAGRDGIAFTRLVWRETCRLMDVPVIWRAIEAVERELFSGLLRQEPLDPRPGDSVKFVMAGGRAEELIEGAGIALPNILAPHQCGPACIKPSRRTSRRWEQYLRDWAKESKDAA